MTISNGSVTEIARRTAAGRQYDVALKGPKSGWTRRDAVLRALLAPNDDAGRVVVEGDRVEHIAPYQAALIRIVTLVGRELGSDTVHGVHSAPSPTERQFDTAVGRYVYVDTSKVEVIS